MATQKGVWNIQQVRDKQLQSLWEYTSSENRIFAWGDNTYGELGQNSRTHYSSPVQIPGTWTKIYPVGAGMRKVFFAAQESGTLYGWGLGSDGLLGQNQGGEIYYSSPVQVPGTTWTSARTRANATIATKTDGTLWAWGYSYQGMLGQNSVVNYSSPVQIPGTAWSKVRNGAQMGILAKALKTDGTLWSWGKNGYGGMGQNDRTTRSSPTQIPGTWASVVGGDLSLLAKT